MDKNTLFDWVKERESMGLRGPIQLAIGVNKVADHRTSWFITVKIDGYDVTQMVAEACGLPMSVGFNTYNSLIMKGIGLNVGTALQSRLYGVAKRAGYPDMFDKTDFINMGQRNRDGSYPHDQKMIQRGYSHSL